MHKEMNQMMKKVSFVLSLVLVLTFFAGCAAEEKMEQVEERADAFVERQENKAEQYLESRVESVLTTQTTQPTQPISGEESVTKEQAEQIALDYVGFSRNQVTGLRTEFEIDDGISQFNVEFRVDNWEYEFEIHEKTGKILSYDRDQERF